MARDYLKVLGRQVLNNVGISGNRRSISIADFHHTGENPIPTGEHDATPVDAGQALPILVRAVLQAGSGGNVPGCLRQLPIAQISQQIPSEDDPLPAPLKAAVMDLTLRAECQGTAGTGEDVRGALQTIGENAGRIKQGLAKLKAQGPHYSSCRGHPWDGLFLDLKRAVGSARGSTQKITLLTQSVRYKSQTSCF